MNFRTTLRSGSSQKVADMSEDGFKSSRTKPAAALEKTLIDTGTAISHLCIFSGSERTLAIEMDIEIIEVLETNFLEPSRGFGSLRTNAKTRATRRGFIRRTAEFNGKLSLEVQLVTDGK
jgi:hypothetical protein